MQRQEVIEILRDIQEKFNLQLGFPSTDCVIFSGIFFMPDIMRYIFEILYTWDLKYLYTIDEKETWFLIKKV